MASCGILHKVFHTKQLKLLTKQNIFVAGMKEWGVVGKIGDDIYMTPEDFLRSITPGVKQPDGVGLDQYM